MKAAISLSHFPESYRGQVIWIHSWRKIAVTLTTDHRVPLGQSSSSQLVQTPGFVNRLRVIAFYKVSQYASGMKELGEVLLGMAVLVGLGWLYFKLPQFYERIFGRPLESLPMRWLKRRNRPTTVLGKNDEDVL